MDNIANQATLLYNNMTTNSNTVTTQILSLYDLTATKEALLDTYTDRKSTRLNSSHASKSRMPSSA